MYNMIPLTSDAKINNDICSFHPVLPVLAEIISMKLKVWAEQ